MSSKSKLVKLVQAKSTVKKKATAEERNVENTKKPAREADKREKMKKAKAVSRSQRSGLVFPVGRVLRLLRKGHFAKRIGAGAAVYMAAVLEYLTAEWLEMAGTFAGSHGRKRITPRFVLLSLEGDDEMKELLQRGNTIISEAGVIPKIEKSLFPKLPKKKKQKQNEALEPKYEMRNEIATEEGEESVDEDEGDENGNGSIEESAGEDEGRETADEDGNEETADEDENEETILENSGESTETSAYGSATEAAHEEIDVADKNKKTTNKSKVKKNNKIK